MDECSDPPRIGLLGGEESVAGTIREVASTPVRGDPDGVLAADVDAVVAVGRAALLSLARSRPDVPVLPVEAGTGVRSIPRSALAEALAAVMAGDARTDAHPLLAVGAGDESAAMALFDAALVAAEPARISGFTLEPADEKDGGSIGPFRADGVVLATPAGTSGYASSLDAPTVAPGTGVLAVEPVAQFATRPDRWMVPADRLTVTVAPGETPASVLADGRNVGEVGPGEPVTVAPDGNLETLVVPASPSALDGGGAELEKH